MKKRINLFSVFNNPMIEGIFTALQEYDVPWKSENISTELNIDYLYNISGNRTISPIVNTLVSPMYHKLDTQAISLLARIIYKRYSLKWRRLYATYYFEYDPISNYDMTEQMINDTTQHEHTDSDTLTVTQEKQTQYGKTDTTTNNLQSQTQYGKTDTTTNNLQSQTQYGKTDTTTNNLQSQTQYGKTDTTTNNLQSQTQYGKTDTTTNNLETTVNTENETVRDFAGFNSAEYSKADKETQTGESVTSNTGTQAIASSGTDTRRDTGTQAIASSGSDTKSDTGTQAIASSGTDIQSNTGTQTVDSSGSDTKSDTGTQAIASSGTDTRRDTGTQAIASSGTDTENTDESHSREITGTSTDTRNYKLTRRGNIGVTTSQQMIQSERDLWLWDFFKEIVYPDIDNVLTMSYYGGY